MLWSRHFVQLESRSKGASAPAYCGLGLENKRSAVQLNLSDLRMDKLLQDPTGLCRWHSAET